MKTTSSAIAEFPPAKVKPFAGQPRKRFRGISELAQSIRAVGQIIPGKVVPLEGDAKFDAQLIDGERRLRACALAGKPFRAEVCAAAPSEDDQFETSLAANFGKQDHDCIEIAEALGRLQARGRTVKEMADICGGKSSTWVAQHLGLLKLHPEVQALLIVGEDDEAAKLAFTTACMLSNHPEDFQLRMARKIAKGGLSFVQARRLVLREAQRKGLRATKDNVPPLERFCSLDACINNLIDRIGVFTDLPRRDLDALIAASDPRSRQDLVNKINALNDNLSGIADDLEHSLQIAGRKVLA